MASDVETYLQELQSALVSSGADPALVQDALFDAEEHLQAEMAAGGQGEAAGGAPLSAGARAERFAAAVEGYGTPEEVAAAYLGVSPAQATPATMEVAAAGVMGVAAADSAAAGPVAAAGEQAPPHPQLVSDTSVGEESPAQPEMQTGVRCPVCGAGTRPDQTFCASCGAQLRAVLPPPSAAYPPGGPLPAGVQYGMQAAGAGGMREPSVWRQIFGPFADGRVWTSLVYMILSLATGIAYFTVVVTGVSTAGGMIVLIVGIPLFMLVLALVRGLSLFEGRLVEALLGTRMPRRLRPTPPDFGFWQRMLFWLKDGRTWASMAYEVLMLPIGIVYFTLAVTGLAVGLSLVTAPIWGWFAWGFSNHWVEINDVNYHWPLWGIPIAFVVGLLWLIGFMHLVKWIGRGHAAFAKAMLVRLK